MKHLLLALQFLTIIPVRVGGDPSEKEIADSSIFFPVIGALQGLLLLISALLLSRIFPLDIVSGFVIVMAVISNGGFHLDGLADTFDALAVKSSGDAMADREKRLAVMKDSLTGSIGVVAVVLIILLKFVLIRNLLSFPVPLTAFLLLFLMPVFSKWTMVPAMYLGVPARNSGLGKIFIDGASIRCLMFSSALMLVFFIGLFGAHIWIHYGLRGMPFFIMLPAGYLLALSCAGYCNKIFGGLTGDTLGALSELSEIFYLTGAYIWLQHCI
jgi:adenosylcobinamide-GDP ribazoletransferase